MSAPRLTPERYLDLLRVEGERLLVVAQDAMDRPVPTCDGWTVDDVVFHVGGVYAHKVAAVRLGRQPVEGEWVVPADDSTAADDVAWCHGMLHAVVSELAHRPPDQRAWTWWAPDQTVGFWQRRMANETAVHRVDVESALGMVTPIDSDLARDGIDEYASVILPGAGIKAAEVEVVGDRVTVHFDAIDVRGGACDVLLWLWGRLPDEAVTSTGSAEQLADLRTVLTEGGQ